jgi:hypothetical protein
MRAKLRWPLLVTGMAFVIASAALTFAAPVAADEETGVVLFRLTLRGDVDPKDTFTLAIREVGAFDFMTPDVLCQPRKGSEASPYGSRPVCAPADYEIRIHWPVGHEVEFAFSRLDDGHALLPGSQLLYSSSVAVSATPQTRYFVFDYSLALPNTALAAAAAPLWLASITIGVLLTFAVGVHRVLSRGRAGRGNVKV